MSSIFKRKLNELEEEAIQFLKDNEPKEEGYQLSFSGGKDSIVMRHLADMSGVKYDALFNCTTIEPPEMYKFIKKNYPNTTWHFPKQPFFKLLEKNGPVNHSIRWCCQALKETNNLPGKHHILIGIRSEESSRRKARKRIEEGRNKKGIIYYAPIKEWKEWQVWEHIERYNLPYPSLYDEEYTRIGCKICPLTFSASEGAQKRLEMAKKRYPHFTKRFEECLHKWWDNRTGKKLNSFSEFSTFEEWLNFYYHGMRKDCLKPKTENIENKNNKTIDEKNIGNNISTEKTTVNNKFKNNSIDNFF